MRFKSTRPTGASSDAAERRRAAADYQARLFIWYGAMQGARSAMPKREQRALDEWERGNLDGEHTSSDWPGWLKYIGSPPVPPCSPDRPIRATRKTSAQIALAVFRRDRFTCQRCGTHDGLVVDHIVPLARGGASEFANYQTLCSPCNALKGCDLV